MRKDYTGERFNMLTVVSFSHSEKKDGWWNVRCDCGVEKKISSGNMRHKNNVSCGCHRNKKGETHNAFRGVGRLGNSVFNRFKIHAKKRHILFDLTIEDAWNIFEKQNGECALSGIKLELPTDYRYNWFTRSNASIDRIDSNKGYSLDNVQWVTKKINMMKQANSQSEFIEMCKLVAKKFDNKNE